MIFSHSLVNLPLITTFPQEVQMMRAYVIFECVLMRILKYHDWQVGQRKYFIPPLLCILKGRKASFLKGLTVGAHLFDDIIYESIYLYACVLYTQLAYALLDSDVLYRIYDNSV